MVGLAHFFYSLTIYFYCLKYLNLKFATDFNSLFKAYAN